ncbi:MAG: type II secretion system protein GspC [Nitrococcus sp.]|nr:type II secretion system protein GspC [Nitrococcus sp.]
MLDRFIRRFSAGRTNTNRLASLTAVALTVALAHALARITWLAWPQAQTDHAPPPAVATSASKPAVALTALADQHLFGRVGLPRAPREHDAHVPETRLNLNLHGVLHTPESAWVIIAADGGADRLYQKGDKLPGGAAVEAIYSDRVILLTNGRREALRLPRKHLQSISVHDSAASRPAADVANTLGDYRDRIVSRPDVLAEYLRISPVRNGDALTGFRVWPGSNPALFEAAGLRPGDLVTAVGEMPLTSQQAALKALKRLRSGNKVTLAVLRDGRQEIIVLDFG